MLDKSRFLIVFLVVIEITNGLKPTPEVPELDYSEYFKDDILHNITKEFKDGLLQRDRSFERADLEDRYLNTSQLIIKYGYIAEEHYVITEDGYNLTLIRIPNSGPPVFLMHGFPSSSDDFVTAGPDKALAYMLANASYDVWIGNARGNKYSRRHVRLSTERRNYWEFTWNEIGIYDVPAMIDTILKISQQSRLTYIGHAQGTTVFFVMCSSRPEYNTKVRLFIGLAVVTWDWHIKSPVVKAIVPYRQEAYDLAQAIGLYEFLPRSPFALLLTSVICSSSRFTLLLCSTVLFNLFGFDYSQIDYDNSPVQLSHIPSGGSLKQIIHYAQLVASKRFALFDYGEQSNLQKYNQSSPPDYPVENVVAPVVIFHADNDWISSFDDVQILIDRLPNVQAIHRVPHSRFNHFDYVWGKDSGQLVYWKIMDTINRDYNNGFGISYQDVNNKS